MKNIRFITFFFTAFFIVGFGQLSAQETSVMIRAQAKDAKFIGSSMGGAKIIVKNSTTGEVLAQGITQGSTGNTQKIIVEPKKRYALITDEHTAGFLAKLNIENPVFVTVEAYAPLNAEQAKAKVTKQFWVLPGKDITGDGIILEFSGFVVDIVAPKVHQDINTEKTTISAHIVMLCGCPITEGGLWDANGYEVSAQIRSEGEVVEEIELGLKEKPSTFYGETALAPGSYELTVFAFDAKTGNTGLDRTNFSVE